MPSSNRAAGRNDPIASHVRPLPAAPSLEFERKSAKALLRQIRAGDADALRRVHRTHPVSLRDRRPDELQLADAQHVIAREYGFTSWPRLVEYFDEMERHRSGPRHNSADDETERFEAQARSVVRRHQRGDPIVARELAHFVPRFYGRPVPEILATPITEDEARLVVAREYRRVSWEELVERASASRAWRDRKMWQDEDAPSVQAGDAIRAQDVHALAAILDEHPEVLKPSVVDREWRSTLVSLAVSLERDAKTVDARRVTDLLAVRGADIQRELDERLLGWPLDWGHPERVRWYLDRGANPNWMPPNGITVLEHAIVRWKSSECVDAIAARVPPRRALWIAAALGDVPGMRSFVAGQGRLTPEGRLNRPDLMAMGWLASLPPDQEADDLDIMWEAFQIAGWNGRWAAMDALLASGLPVDHAPGWPLLMEAVGNMLLPLAEYLIGRGADLDREWPSAGSARALARMRVRHSSDPESDDARRLLAICGAGTPEEILAESEAKRQSPPPPDERTSRALQLAADDAARQGQAAVTTENMLIGLLRVSGGVFAECFMGTGTDMPKLRAIIGARLLPDNDPLGGQELPLDAGAQAAARMATAEADAHRHERVHAVHLLRGILSQGGEPGARVLAEAGATEEAMWERLESIS